jgi:hypothetical protein
MTVLVGCDKMVAIPLIELNDASLPSDRKLKRRRRVFQLPASMPSWRAIRRALPVGRSDSTMALRPFLRRGNAKKPKAGPSPQRANRRMATVSV